MKVVRRAFTVVELIVSMSVIAILIAITLPAIQGSRETARKAECRNRLRQIGIAAQSFESVNRHIPGNGWGFQWTGDPNRGAGPRQPGGWIYQLLPYLEAEAIGRIGAGETGVQQMQTLAARNAMPVSALRCPTRPAPLVGPANTGLSFINAVLADPVAKTDYAICEGDLVTDTLGGPDSLADGDNPNYPWKDVSSATGVSFLRSRVTYGGITDGSSQTYLVGEKYVDKTAYQSADDLGYDQTLYSGVDLDLNRWTVDPPLKDGEGQATRVFGSAHQEGCFFVLCDGSVKQVSYLVDREAHRRLGNRKDGKSVGDF